MSRTSFFKHESAIVEKGVKIGKGTKIWHHSHIDKSAVVGKNNTIGQNCYIAGIIENHCKIQNNVNVYLGVILEDYVFCGPSMTFTNVSTPRAKYPKNGNYEKTLVKTGASIGAHATILPGITIGSWTLIGAGSVVTKDIPNYAIAYGNPAKVRGWICECGKKLPKEFKKAACKNCLRAYQKKGIHINQL